MIYPSWETLRKNFTQLEKLKRKTVKYCHEWDGITNKRTNIRTDEQKDKNYIPLSINADDITMWFYHRAIPQGPVQFYKMPLPSFPHPPYTTSLRGGGLRVLVMAYCKTGLAPVSNMSKRCRKNDLGLDLHCLPRPICTNTWDSQQYLGFPYCDWARDSSVCYSLSKKTWENLQLLNDFCEWQ